MNSNMLEGFAILSHHSSVVSLEIVDGSIDIR
jgi:hypothetical protein